MGNDNTKYIYSSYCFCYNDINDFNEFDDGGQGFYSLKRILSEREGKSNIHLLEITTKKLREIAIYYEGDKLAKMMDFCKTMNCDADGMRNVFNEIIEQGRIAVKAQGTELLLIEFRFEHIAKHISNALYMSCAKKWRHQVPFFLLGITLDGGLKNFMRERSMYGTDFGSPISHLFAENEFFQTCQQIHDKMMERENGCSCFRVMEE